MTSAAAGLVRGAHLTARPKGRWVMRLVYDKALGGMRAVERWVP